MGKTCPVIVEAYTEEWRLSRRRDSNFGGKLKITLKDASISDVSEVFQATELRTVVRRPMAPPSGPDGPATSP
jgi:hypothetical protein